MIENNLFLIVLEVLGSPMQTESHQATAERFTESPLNEQVATDYSPIQFRRFRRRPRQPFLFELEAQNEAENSDRLCRQEKKPGSTVDVAFSSQFEISSSRTSSKPNETSVEEPNEDQLELLKPLKRHQKKPKKLIQNFVSLRLIRNIYEDIDDYNDDDYNYEEPPLVGPIQVLDDNLEGWVVEVPAMKVKDEGKLIKNTIFLN
jgi:hypothetical protein